MIAATTRQTLNKTRVAVEAAKFTIVQINLVYGDVFQLITKCHS